MFFRVQENYWYRLQGHKTHTTDFSAGESNFCQFSQNDTPMSMWKSGGCEKNGHFMKNFSTSDQLAWKNMWDTIPN